MLPKTKNPQKTKANIAIYCLSTNTYSIIREKENKLCISKASKKCSRNKLTLNVLSKPTKSDSESVNSSKFKYITFNLTFFTVNALRECVYDSFIKQGQPVSSSTSLGNPDSH